MNNEQTLRECVCGNAVSWCEDENHKCHRIVCKSCGIMVDYILTEEENTCETLEELRKVVAAKWNRRTSQQGQALSDEEIIAVRKATKIKSFEQWSDSIAFARAIENKLHERRNK